MSNTFIQHEADGLQIGEALVTAAKNMKSRVTRPVEPPVPVEELLKDELASEFMVARRCGCGACTQSFTVYLAADGTGLRPSRKGRQRLYADGHDDQGDGIRRDLGRVFMRTAFDVNGDTAITQMHEAAEALDAVRASGLSPEELKALGSLLRVTDSTGEDLVELLSVEGLSKLDGERDTLLSERSRSIYLAEGDDVGRRTNDHHVVHGGRLVPYVDYP